MTKEEMEKLITEGIGKCKLGQYEDAITDFNAASEFSLSEALLYNRSKAFFRLRKLDDAMNDLNMLIDLQPGNPTWYAERAVIYHYHKNKKDALIDLDTAVALDPENGFRYSSRAFIRDFYGDLEGAIMDYERAITLDPEDAVSFNNKGLVEEKLGYIEKAKASFANADNLAPGTFGFSKADLADSGMGHKVEKTKTPVPGNMTLQHYFKTIREIFSNKQGAQSFLNFIFGKK